MEFFALDKESCCKDGLCAKVCPCAVITIDAEGYPELRPRSARNCISCGHCMAICPTKALRLGPHTYEEYPDLMGYAALPPEKLVTFLESRRSIRNFKKETLPGQLVEQILDATRFAPTASNRRPVKWISVSGPEKVAAISELTAEWMKNIPEASPCHRDAARYKAVGRAYSRERDPILRGTPNLVIAYADADTGWSRIDCVVALTYSELYAHALGIGACWAGYFTAAAQEFQPLREFLGLGEDAVVGGGQMLGWAGARYRRLPWRKNAPIRHL